MSFASVVESIKTVFDVISAPFTVYNFLKEEGVIPPREELPEFKPDDRNIFLCLPNGDVKIENLKDIYARDIGLYHNITLIELLASRDKSLR